MTSRPSNTYLYNDYRASVGYLKMEKKKITFSTHPKKEEINNTDNGESDRRTDIWNYV